MFSLMGNCISSIKRSREPNKQFTVAVLGLDGAGKTTLSKCLLGEQLDTAPTVGFNNEKVTFRNHEITLYDVGGGKRIRDIWKNYFGEVYGIIYVVDSGARDRMNEVRDNFLNLLSHQQVTGKPVLFLANKQDLGGAYGENEITAELDIEHATNTNQCPCQIVTCSAMKGTGSKMDKQIRLGMKWLCDVVDKMFDKLKIRVDEDMRVADEKRQKENAEKRERVRKIREERERQEEEEKKQSGQEDHKPDTDDDDIMVGNPFKPLDYKELENKDKMMKENKKKKKDRERENVNGQIQTVIQEDTSGFHLPMSSRSLKSYGLSNDDQEENQGEEFSDEDKDFEEDFLKIPTPSRLTSLLPPIQKRIDSKLRKEEIAIEKKKKKEKNNFTEKHTSDSNLNKNADDPLGESFTMSNTSVSSITRIKVSAMSPGSSEEDLSKRPLSGYNALEADIDSSGLSPGSTPRDGESKGKRKKKKRFLKDVMEKQMQKNIDDDDEFKDSFAKNQEHLRRDNYSDSHSHGAEHQASDSTQRRRQRNKYEMTKTTFHNNVLNGDADDDTLENSHSFGIDTLKFDDNRTTSIKAPIPAPRKKISMPIIDEDSPVRLPKDILYNSRLSPSSDDTTEMSDRSPTKSWMKKSPKSETDIITNVNSSLKWNFAEDLPGSLETSKNRKLLRRPNVDDDDDIML